MSNPDLNFKPVANNSESLPQTHPLVPPLKWAGGKRWLVPHLQRIWQDYHHCRLVEPFCGGLAIALGLQPQRALLNDINPHVINFYQCLQRGLKLEIEVTNANDREFYDAKRLEFNNLIQSGQANSPRSAQIFYYLNRTGYNGLCRFNRSGGFNVPFGRHKTINYIQDFAAYQSVFAKWQFTNTDFEAMGINADDLIYADPPYDVEFRQYSQNGFDWSEQERLAQWLARQNCPVIASNQATARVLELYRDLGFTIELFSAPRRISCNGDRTSAREMLALRGL